MGTSRGAPLRNGDSYVGGPKPRPGHELPHTKRTATNAARKLDRENPDGIDPGTIDDPAVRQAYVDHVSSTPAPSNVRNINTAPSARSAPASSGSRFSITSAGGSISSAILGAAAYALLINVLKGTGTAWVSAKFTNAHGTLP